MFRLFRVAAKLALLPALLAAAQSASAQVVANPTTLNFGSNALNVPSTATVSLTNNGSSAVSLTGITFGMPEYTLNSGLPVQTIGPHTTTLAFSITFMASQVGTYNSTITFNIKGQSSVVVQLEGSAFATNAVATLSTTSLNFGTVNLGATKTLAVTVTNTGGGDELTIEKVDAGVNKTDDLALYYQPFAESGPAPNITLDQGQSATFPVTFSPLTVGPTTATFTFVYDVLPPNAVDLAGTGATPTQFAITNYPAFPYATQGFAYQANMTATGGVPPYIYRVESGSLPSGLTMAKSGSITGTISSTAATGVYSVKVQAQDSTMPKHLSTTENMTLTLDAPTGANCANIYVDVPNTSTPIVDLMDLGTGTYQGEEGGLYPSGSNTDPDPHHSDGVSIAQGLQPINGKIVMISLGESASQQPFDQLITEFNADPEKNPNLVLVDGAQGGATANYWTSESSAFWTELVDYSIPEAGLTASQVQVAWISDVNSQPGVTFPSDAQTLQSDYETIAQNLLYFFPNIKMMFFSSMNYTGYSLGITSTLPEPQAYESAFGAKWAIQDQINGDPNLNYNPNNGQVTAPWMGWSFYYWANGLIPRSDGITWSCQDMKSDGLHPGDPWGHIKFAQYLLNWFKNADLSAPWFVNQAK